MKKYPSNKQQLYINIGKYKKSRKRKKYFNYFYNPKFNNFIRKNAMLRGLYYNNRYEDKKKTIPFNSINIHKQDLPINKLLDISKIKKTKITNVLKKEEPKIIHIKPDSLMNKLKSNLNLIANSTKYILFNDKINKL